MTWLAPASTDYDLVEQVAARNPALYRLALALAPALRVEPLLLRNARLRFLPRSDAGLESELWFSPLAGARSARAVLLRPGAARVLTDRLEGPETPLPFADVWAFVESQTRHWPPEERLEQALRQSARRGDATALRNGLRTALRHIVGANGNGQRQDLARWLKGALPALSPEDRGPMELDLAARFAAATLGDPGGTLGRRIAGDGALPDWLRAAVPSGMTSRLGVRLWPGVLECLPADDAEHRIDLGAPSPALLHIRCESRSQDGGRWEPCWPGRRIPLPSGCTSLVLSALGGARYRLEARPGQAAPTASEPPASDRPVLVAHQPEDAEAAERVAKLLGSAGIEASLLPESAVAKAQGPDDALLLRLWTRAAHRRLASGGAAEAPPIRGLVLRMEDAPLVPGVEAQEVIDLSDWRGDPEAKDARKLLKAIRRLAGKPPEAHSVGETASEQPADTTERDPEIERLLDEIDDPETSPKRRLAIGNRLAELGDPRPGVGVIDGIPDILWCDIPAGEVEIGEHGRFEVAPFRLAAHPVTYAQYQAFLEAEDGYRSKKWWGDLDKKAKPGKQRRLYSNRPVDNVSWYDATAFGRWLSARLGFEVRLPDEWEWQWAAQSARPDFVYPWGPKWREGLASSEETGIGETIAAGMYPDGRSLQGAYDLAGNIWEWCRNRYDDPRQTRSGGDESRVVRGGSWDGDRDLARAGFRGVDRPDGRSGGVGFRVLLSSPIR